VNILRDISVYHEGFAESCSIFLFDSRKMGAILVVVVRSTAMVDVVRRFVCVRASAASSVLIWRAASLATLREFLVGGSRISSLRRCSEILLSIFWSPAAIRINVVYWFG
jgi:hypothetical protein